MRKKPSAYRSLRGCLALLAAAVLLCGCSGSAEETTAPEVQAPVSTVFTATRQEEFRLCSPAAKKVYDHQLSVAEAITTGTPYRPLRFEYCLVNTEGYLLLGEKSDLSDARKYPLDPERNFINIDNLKTNTTYYYHIITGTGVYPGRLRTMASTRFVQISGVGNTRDIGGYKNLDGKTVRQGLLIRGGELDGLQTEAYRLPAEEQAAVLETFGFVYDLDLRSSTLAPADFVSPLGPDVGHAFYNAPAYEQIFAPEKFESLRQIFRDLADPEKYPMYLHCAWGQDRAGCVVFLLQGVLNMPQEDMIREYRLSGYGDNRFADSDWLDPIIARLAEYPGDTLQEQIVSYLTTDVGVTEAELNAIREIFLEEP